MAREPAEPEKIHANEPTTSVRDGQQRSARAGRQAESADDPDGGLATSVAIARLTSLVPGLRLLTGLLIATIVIAALYFGRGLLIPLALAALFGFLLDPAVTRLKRWGLPRAFGVILVVAFALGVVGGIGIYITNQLTGLSADLPAYQSTILSKLHNLRKAALHPGGWDGALKTLESVQHEIDTPPTAAGQATTSPQQVQVVEAPPKPAQLALDWLGRVSEPVATAGIVLLFVILILMDRRDLRDRLLRVAGGDLHAATDAMDEASERIGRYLRMQFMVNIGYGIPMGIGLWFIGVPAAALWGFVAAILRFVPYVGSMVSAVFPLALAFAVAPDWSMVLWTLALIASLELICANVVEPWLYGSSTGLTPLSIIVSATFWTALWGPIGLILSTPLTVCLLVLGRYLPALHFMQVLLGEDAALDEPQRLYQRLLAGDVEEAVELANEHIEEQLPPKPDAAALTHALVGFYDDVAIPTLRLATTHHVEIATAEQRLRLASGMHDLLDEMVEQYPPIPASAGSARAKLLCIGARWEADALAAVIMAHALGREGCDATVSTHPLASTLDADATMHADGVDAVCLSIFSAQPQARIRLLARRLRRRQPHVRIVVAAWNAPREVLGDEMARRLGVDAIVAGINELLLQVGLLLAGKDGPLVPIPANDAERVQALHASGVLAAANESLVRDFARRVASAFVVKYAEVSLVDAEHVHKPGNLVWQDRNGLARDQSMCAFVVGEGEDLVVPDTARDPRFARNALLQEKDIRFYAGTPLRGRDGHILGALCVMDDSPREMGSDEIALLAEMAGDLMREMQERAAADDGTA